MSHISRLRHYPSPVRPTALLVLFLAACSTGTGLPASTTGAPEPSTTVGQPTTTLAQTTTTTDPAAVPDGWTLSAKATSPLEVFDSPDATEPFVVLEPFTNLGSVRVVHVINGPFAGWAEVLVPVRPNGTTGWVREADVEFFQVERRVVVDLSERTLVVLKAGKVEATSKVAIGRPTNATPPGSYFVTDSVILSNPNGPWGPHAFGLSAFSETITEFNGDDAVVGIHGTNAPNSIGYARSLGCVRVPNEFAKRLATLISAGVPVDIQA
jgi:lipoprotein-anchoring transpeptidase ErfK/SrfK